MTNEILDMMEERREFKNQDTTLHKRIDNEIKKQSTQLTEQCAEIQLLQHKHDSSNMHKNDKEAAYTILDELGV